VLEHTSLTFTKAGNRASWAKLIGIQEDQGGIYYFVCDGGCNQRKELAARKDRRARPRPRVEP